MQKNDRKPVRVGRIDECGSVQDRLASLPCGTCAGCAESIPRSEINVAKPFRCPHCQQYLRTTTLSRTTDYVLCYGISAVLAYRLDASWWVAVLAWLVLSFVLGVVYSFLRLLFPAPALELHHGADFQELNIN